MKEWYYIGSAGQPQGPATPEEIRQLAAASGEVYVWKPGMPQWVPSGEAPLDGDARPSAVILGGEMEGTRKLAAPKSRAAIGSAGSRATLLQTALPRATPAAGPQAAARQSDIDRVKPLEEQHGRSRHSEFSFRGGAEELAQMLDNAPGALQTPDGNLVAVRQELRIGRAITNDIVLTNEGISRLHCMIQADAERRCWLHDLASQNGTFVNGARVTEATPLRNGSRIELPGIRITFYCRTR